MMFRLRSYILTSGTFLVSFFLRTFYWRSTYSSNRASSGISIWINTYTVIWRRFLYLVDTQHLKVVVFAYLAIIQEEKKKDKNEAHMELSVFDLKCVCSSLTWHKLVLHDTNISTQCLECFGIFVLFFSIVLLLALSSMLSWPIGCKGDGVLSLTHNENE